MTVPVTKFKGLDTAGAGGYSIVERLGSRGGESEVTILFPHAVQRLESRY